MLIFINVHITFPPWRPIGDSDRSRFRRRRRPVLLRRAGSARGNVPAGVARHDDPRLHLPSFFPTISEAGKIAFFYWDLHGTACDAARPDETPMPHRCLSLVKYRSFPLSVYSRSSSS